MITETMSREETEAAWIAEAFAAFGIGPEDVVSQTVYLEEPFTLHPLAPPRRGVWFVLKSTNRKVHWTPDAVAEPLSARELGVDLIPCGDHFRSDAWMDEIGNRPLAERMHAQLEALGMPCETCAWRGRKGPQSEACRDALAIFAGIRGRKLAVAARAASTPSPATGAQPVPRVAGRQALLTRKLARAKEEAFDFSGV